MDPAVQLGIRKTVTYCEDVLRDMRALEAPVRYVTVAAVLDNPWHGKGFVEDLSPEVRRLAPALGRYLAGIGVDLMGGARSVQAFGKAAMVGLGGEYEHANALIHTTLFGDECRAGVAGSSWMVGNQKLCGVGDTLEVPLAHKDEPKNQNFYHTIHVRIHDAPRPDDLVVALGLASGPRPHARLV